MICLTKLTIINIEFILFLYLRHFSSLSFHNLRKKIIFYSLIRKLINHFHSSDLKKLGFNVSQNKNTIEISRSFDSETELKKILSVMIGSQTYDLRINRQTSILNQKRSILIDINLNKLRYIYLKDENVKKTLSDNGVEFADYENLINKAFDNSTLHIKIKDELINKSTEKEISGKSTKLEKVSLTGEKTRAAFIIGNMGALLALALAIFLAYRKWHSPRLISSHG